ncbi:hypothetical protein [Chitinophaga tropicalis]|uniref:Outer membrane lipoprotein-sorting protein n=1 Tax=Chitinophaga tropicalis TaxID=2683588 RepID=A0A7K1U1K4_9BACT|nr:hypothetical protein [Chitinophaga tropicalis]MVT07905.1 hypothetical protein [Chitinophaga tropicalis]
MQRIFFSMLTATTLFAATANAQVEDIISKHLDAIGGTETLKKVTALKIEGTLNAQGFDIPYTKTIVQGRGFKQVISVMGTDGYFIARTDSGWNYMPFMGQSEPVAMTSTELQQWEDELEPIDNFLDYKAKGATAATAEAATIDGRQYPAVKLTFKTGYSKTFYFDPSTWYIVRTVCMKTTQGSETEMQSDYSGFEKLPEGFTIAKTIVTPAATYSINKVEVNPVVDAAILKPAGN